MLTKTSTSRQGIASPSTNNSKRRPIWTLRMATSLAENRDLMASLAQEQTEKQPRKFLRNLPPFCVQFPRLQKQDRPDESAEPHQGLNSAINPYTELLRNAEKGKESPKQKGKDDPSEEGTAERSRNGVDFSLLVRKREIGLGDAEIPKPKFLEVPISETEVPGLRQKRGTGLEDVQKQM